MSGASALSSSPVRDLLRLVWQFRRILVSVTRVELEKRHSGSALGKAWLLIHPLLLLGIYLFVYSVVFRMSLPGYLGMDYTLFVFCGLVPFIGLSEALTTGCLCLKQNMHLIKNVMLPTELVPIRTVLASLATQTVGLALLLLLLALTGHLSWKLVLLPAVFALQVLMLIGLTFILASLAVALTDVSYFVNLSVMLLMFISPIGFTREMVPAPFGVLVDLNPVTYMAEAYRTVLLGEHAGTPLSLAVFAALSVVCFGLGAMFFARFKGVLVDYE